MAHAFRNSMTHKAGTDPTQTMQCKILNVNIVNWTVDVVTVFDKKRYFDIQVASPYLHFNAGEGIYVVPEVGALCHVCLPGDSSPPFIQGFVAPLEIRTETGSEEAPVGTRSRGDQVPHNTDASFAAGRHPAKPGDIIIKTRDGNFLILHRGGILQIGATEVAQRIYTPIGNRVVDFVENYEMQSVAGTLSWRVLEEVGKDETPCEWKQTFRLYAQDKYADIRVTKGKVQRPIGEHDGSDTLGVMQSMGIGEGADAPIVYEIAISPGGFLSDGEAKDASTKNETVLRYVVDRKGNVFFRSEGNVYASIHGKLRLRVKQTALFEGDEDLTVKFDTIAVTGTEGLDLSGKLIRLNKGSNPVARQGDPVKVMPGMIGPLLITPVPNPATPGIPPVPPAPFFAMVLFVSPVTGPISLDGSITGGNPTVTA